MNDLLEFIKNPKDREDFFIAIIVIALFGLGIVYSIFPRNNYDASLTEQELADNFKQSLADGTLKSKIFTDLESSDEIIDADEKEVEDSEEAAIEEKNRMVLTNVKPTKDDSPVIVDKNQSVEQTPEVELYDKKQKEAADLKAAAAAIEKTKRLEAEKAAKNLEKETTTDEAEELNTAEAKKAEELRTIEELKKAEEIRIAKAQRDQELKAAEELKIIAEAKKAEELKAAEDAKNRPINQSPTTNNDKKESVAKEYNKTKPKKKSNQPKAKPSGPKADCVVVVGAFKNAEGVELVLKKLRAANYKTTTGYIRGLKYVGVPIYCDKNNDKVIKDLNDKFDKEAWVLKR